MRWASVNAKANPPTKQRYEQMESASRVSCVRVSYEGGIAVSLIVEQQIGDDEYEQDAVDDEEGRPGAVHVQAEVGPRVLDVQRDEEHLDDS